VRVSIKLPRASVGGQNEKHGRKVQFRLKVLWVCPRDHCESGAYPYPYVCPFVILSHTVLQGIWSSAVITEICVPESYLGQSVGRSLV
jgi:hypothetical protein